MKNIRMAAIVLAALASVTSCDKDNDANPSGSTLSKLQAKWGVQSIQIDLPGGEDDSTYNGAASDYFDFKTDNKVYSQWDGQKDTSAYALLNDSTLIVDGDTSLIKQISSSQLVLTETFTELGDTSKITYNLKK